MFKTCASCGEKYSSKAYQSLYCSKKCRTKVLNERRRKSQGSSCECVNCGASFVSKNRLYCSDKCKGQYKYQVGAVTTTSQYEMISGNWKRYLSRLLYAAGRKRDGLSREDLLEILESQNYLCAISGLPLTCQLEKGVKFWSNASVDRIEAGGSYSKNNIQLVCRAVNSWRSDMPLDLFIKVCKAVTLRQEGLEGKDGPA